MLCPIAEQIAVEPLVSKISSLPSTMKSALPLSHLPQRLFFQVMSTLEDKILGEKLHNYCSSSEESENENSDSEESIKQKAPTEEEYSAPEINKWEGTSSNTGPKGVIKDWQRYKQLRNRKEEGS
ncbi:hypothetical protein NQ318_003812 [Aromia moschata]|uniref:Phosducin domain-containing protein n=1 Tax=Aromia moschata TaxID=1265417 RepID=A0AAV8XWN9_9CUCU|nr:hypothetical protein NQ318_003812 [Aromia moschata]